MWGARTETSTRSTRRTARRSGATRPATSSARRRAIAKGVVYVGSNDGFLYALDAAEGTHVWRFDTHGDEWKAVTPSPIIVDGAVYCGSRNPFFYAFDAATGKEKWRFSFGASWVESSAAFDNGVIYVGSSDADKVFAIDAATGEKRWEYKAKGATWSSPAVGDGVVYIGDVDYIGLVGPRQAR